MLLSHLMDHERWAAEAVARALAERGVPGSALARFAHLAGTHALWLARVQSLARVQGLDPPLAVWPDLGPQAARASLLESIERWRALLAGGDDLARRVEYVNSKGEPWTSSLGEIVVHVLLHSAYHRGQIASDLRAAGLEPPYTDYVQATRSEAHPRLGWGAAD